MMEWGLLPAQVQAVLRQREWDNSANLRARLTGERAFPLRFNLKVPTGSQALQNLQHFQQFQRSWKSWPQKNIVQWQQKQYRQLGKQTVPECVQLDSMQDMLSFLGSDAIKRSVLWQQQMQAVLSLNHALYPVLVQHLGTLEMMTADESVLLGQVLPQLKAGMGQGNYLRALPLQYVDTKFVERYQLLLADLLDVMHQGAVQQAGGLQAWLGCCDKPKGWLMVRGLDAASRAGLCALPLLQISADVLLNHRLPAANILIIENKQSGYALPELADTIAVFGGGRNTAWMDADWLKHKRIAYWGDIDSWGLTILSEARQRQPDLQVLMMDEKTLLGHQNRMVAERQSITQIPEYLTVEEQLLFSRLIDGTYGKARLEQERLAPDYIQKCLLKWCAVET